MPNKISLDGFYFRIYIDFSNVPKQKWYILYIVQVNNINYLATFGKLYLWMAVYKLLVANGTNENIQHAACCGYKTIIIYVKTLSLFNFKSHHILVL